MGRFGLIGSHIKHSLSPRIHTLFYEYYSLNHTYELIEIKQLGDVDFKAFDGLNITMPYKLDIAKHLDLPDAISNTFDQKTNTLHNTDAFGFHFLLKHYGIDITSKNVTILGNGQTAQFIKESLKEAASVTLIKRRDGDYKKLDLFPGDILINASPQGMNDETPLLVSKEHLDGYQVVIDLLYTPFRTPLLMLADELNIKHHNGLMMLVAQAVKSECIWNDIKLDEVVIKHIYQQLLFEQINIVFMGLPGCGKTTFSKQFKNVISIDEEIEKEGKSITQIFNEYGESYFRELEHQKIIEMSTKRQCVIDLGGGAVENKDNIKALKKNGFIVYLKRDVLSILETLDKTNRPMFQKQSFQTLCERRIPMYVSACDFEVDLKSDAYELLKERMKLL